VGGEPDSGGGGKKYKVRVGKKERESEQTKRRKQE